MTDLHQIIEKYTKPPWSYPSLSYEEND
jgi:hypothetical protein